ncbi:MAG: metallophosphoesterase, partial [Planctomycetota bacterium]|nr:metallophosphoesterase [Planctomycetota bacterium]
SHGATARPSEYHYHSSPAYPYIMSQFRGVVERTNHPRAQGVRPHTPPLRGAHVVSWSEKGGWYEVGYELRNGDKQSIRYRQKGEDSYEFQFIDARGQTVTKNYAGRQRGGGGRGPGRGNGNDGRGGRRRGPEGRDGQDDRRGPPREREGDGGVRQPWILVHAGELDGNGDGSITRAEMLDQANKTIASYDRDGNGKISSAELESGGREARLAMAGFVRKHAGELDDNGNGLLEAAEILAHAGRMFGRADGNGDGVVTAKELGQLERGPGSQGAERGQAGEGRRRGGREGRGEGAGDARSDQQQRSRRNMATEIRSGSAAFRTEVPSNPLDIILGRPTDTAVTASVLSYTDREAYLEYGTIKGDYSGKTTQVLLSKGKPSQILIDGLDPNQRYYYRLRHRDGNTGAFGKDAEHTFHTARARGSAFVFTVQADSHLDDRTEPAMYLQTLRNALADGSDFHIALGDAFMTDKRQRDFTDAHAQYLAQRYYFGQLCHSAPLFFALGNHDGESGSQDDGSANNISVWSNQTRKRYIPNPVPNGFYSGSNTAHPHAGLLQNYYSFEWGDCLFLVLDPYWYTTGRSRDGGNWDSTLGKEQYQWLQDTLEKSRSKFQFLFLHHLVGGADRQARGGVAAARLGEWGGRDTTGENLFGEKRPGWAMPIHDLLKRYGVEAVFHGHDHMFAKEELDGIVYQLVPQPGHPGNNTRIAQEYGYVHGDVLPSPGHVRVSVNGDTAVVDFVTANVEAVGRGRYSNGEVAYTYTLQARAGAQH